MAVVFPLLPFAPREVDGREAGAVHAARASTSLGTNGENAADHIGAPD